MAQLSGTNKKPEPEAFPTKTPWPQEHGEPLIRTRRPVGGAAVCSAWLADCRLLPHAVLAHETDQRRTFGVRMLLGAGMKGVVCQLARRCDMEACAWVEPVVITLSLADHLRRIQVG